MSSVSFIFIILMMLGGGPRGGSDLLDLVPAETYWQLKQVAVSSEQLQRDAGPDAPVANISHLLKGMESPDFATRDKARKELELMGPAVIPQLRPAMASKDAEVSAAASSLVKRFTERGQERAIRRLMAIRTLGERKEAGALPLLRGEVNSQELFVSEYALRAIAAIEGHALEAADVHKRMEEDLSLLPENLSIVGQGVGAGQIDFSTVLGQVADAAGQQNAALPAQEKFDRDEFIKGAVRQLVQLLDRVGNVRIDGVTVGVSSDASDDAGWGIVIVRGRYNAEAVHGALRELSGPGGAASQPAAIAEGAVVREAEKEGGMRRIDTGESSPTLLLPSNDRLIVVMGDGVKQRGQALDALLPALKAGKGTFDRNRELAGVIKGIDRTGPAWAAARPNAAIKAIKMLEGFDTITLETKAGKEAVDFLFKGTGADAEKVKGSTALFAQDIRSMQQTIQQQMQMVGPEAKRLQPAQDFAMSLKAESVEKEGTLSGTMKTAIVQMLLAEVAPMLRMEMQSMDATQRGIGNDAGAPARLAQ
jgi:hypothetical protein